MTPRTHIAAIYLVAFIVALAVTYAVMRVQAGALFAPGQSGPAGLRLFMAPLAGVAGFALVYGLLRGRALRGMFWLLALGALLALWCATFLLISAGVPVLNALGLPVLVLMPAGLAAAIRAEGV